MFVVLGRHWVQTLHLPWGGPAFICLDVLTTLYVIMHALMTFWLKALLCLKQRLANFKNANATFLPTF